VSTLGKRTVSVLIGAPIFVLILYLGHLPLALLLTGLYVLAVREWAQVLRPNVGGLPVAPLAAGGVLPLLAVLHVPPPGGVGLAFLLLVGLAATFSTSTLGATGLAVLGALYVGWPLLLLQYLRAEGFERALFVVAVIWTNDILAYLAGTFVGRHPLIPHISPKKTWEGSLGGLAAAAVLGWGTAPWLGLPPPLSLGLALLVAALAQVGDLVESQIKRLVAAKDSGTFLPGHGGVLDRFDAVLFAVPAVYYLLQSIGH
jgi:phosphatidate cytidylyltransferase